MTIEVFLQGRNKRELFSLHAFALVVPSAWKALLPLSLPGKANLSSQELSVEVPCGSPGCLKTLCWALTHTVLCYIAPGNTCWFSPQPPALVYELSEGKGCLLTTLPVEEFNNYWLYQFM